MPGLFDNVLDRYVQLTEGTERPACWVHPALQVPWKEAVCIYAQHLPCWHKGAAQRCGPWHAKHRAFRARTVLKQCTDTSTGCEFLTSQIRYTLAPNEPERRCGRRTEEDQPKTCRRNALCAHLPSQCPVLSMIRPMQVLLTVLFYIWRSAS